MTSKNIVKITDETYPDVLDDDFEYASPATNIAEFKANTDIFPDSKTIQELIGGYFAAAPLEDEEALDRIEFITNRLKRLLYDDGVDLFIRCKMHDETDDNTPPRSGKVVGLERGGEGRPGYKRGATRFR